MLLDIKSTKKDIRNFALLFGFIFLIIGLLFYSNQNSNYKIFLSVSLFFIASGIIYPKILKPIYFIWMVFANMLSWFMSRLILSILFYIIITPIGLIARLFNKQFIELKWDKSLESYWNYLPKKVEKESYEQQF